MQTHYDTVYLGASCFALGAALQAPTQTLILEAQEGLGNEFCAALRVARQSIQWEDAGAPLYHLLESHGVMDEQRRLSLPALQILLNALVLDRLPNILFHARVAEVHKENEHMVIKYVCQAKWYTITCRQLVDTQSRFEAIHTEDPNTCCMLNANLWVPDGVPFEMISDGLWLAQGAMAHEGFFCMRVNTPSPRNREQLHCAFERRPAAYFSCRLTTVARTHAVYCKPLRVQTETGWLIPSCGFDNPIAAFAAGQREKEACV